ncbi:MAG: hypothetical protein GY853_16855 [PVC group bacterium]|nr:hypothetical protein [PVC group bacterium]
MLNNKGFTEKEVLVYNDKNELRSYRHYNPIKPLMNINSNILKRLTDRYRQRKEAKQALNNRLNHMVDKKAEALIDTIDEILNG